MTKLKPKCEVCGGDCRYSDQTGKQEVRFCGKECRKKRHNNR